MQENTQHSRGSFAFNRFLPFFFGGWTDQKTNELPTQNNV